ncbi:MAG: alpha/beta hydrolase [Chromatiales bacterium]|jgi:pimeloyl-ACP methyl ester carboxylesterase
MAEIEARGVQFHYQRLGSGPERVVFLHGFVWDNLSSWYFSVATSVARSAEILLYDLRGHGKSERTRSGYTLEDMVADLDALLDATAFGDRPVHLVGNSFGGLLALAYAIVHPERVASIVLVDAHVADETWTDEMRATLQSQGQERDRKIIQAFHEWAGRHNDPRNTRLAKAAQELVSETDLLEELTRPAVFSDQDLARIRCPVLAIYGERSDIRHKGERLAGQLPNCELEILAGGSHVILWEATAHLRDRIIAWLEQHRTAGPGAGGA